MVTDFGLSKSFGNGGEWIETDRCAPHNFSLLSHFSINKRLSPCVWSRRAPPRQSNDVVTEGYVPPELLLGAQSYGPEVDIWVRQIQTHASTAYPILYVRWVVSHHCGCVAAQGVGCVFAELMLRRPFMGGPFLRGGHTDQRVTEDSRERLRYRRKHSTALLHHVPAIDAVLAPAPTVPVRAAFSRHGLIWSAHGLDADGQVDMLNVIANTIGLPPGMPGLPAPTAAMQAAAGTGDGSQWPGYPLQPVIASGAQHPPPSSLDKTFGSFGREAVGLLTRCACWRTVCVRARLVGWVPSWQADRLLHCLFDPLTTSVVLLLCLCRR